MSHDPSESEPRPATSTGPTDVEAELEAEIEAALADMSIEDMLDLGDGPREPGGARERRTGTVVSADRSGVLVEFGPKSQGLCPFEQFETPPQPGEKLEFEVDRYDEKEGLLMLSRKGAVQRAEWESLEVGQVIEARCTAMVKGGLEFQVGSHKAFMPAGQVDTNFVKDISIFLNEKVTCEVIQLDRRRGRLVLSRRKVVSRQREERRKELMETIEVGRHVPAVITSVQPYGAFADIGGVDGLIHISDMAYERINHPSEAVKEGDQVEVEILKVEPGDKRGPRISLGMKQCMQDPFQAKAGELEEGQTVSGRITRIMPFGAFMEITPGVEGLIHISQLAYERINRVEQVLKQDEVVSAKILSIDPKSRRISLSVKALKEAPKGSKGPVDEANFSRDEDPHMRKLKAQLSSKFGENLKGGIG